MADSVRGECYWRVRVCPILFVDFRTQKNSFQQMMKLSQSFEFRLSQLIQHRMARDWLRTPAKNGLPWYPSNEKIFMKADTVTKLGLVEMKVIDSSLVALIQCVYDLKRSKNSRLRIELQRISREEAVSSRLKSQTGNTDSSWRSPFEDLKVNFSFRFLLDEETAFSHKPGHIKTADDNNIFLKKIPNLVPDNVLQAVFPTHMVHRNRGYNNTGTAIFKAPVGQDAQKFMENYDGVLINNEPLELSTTLSTLRAAKDKHAELTQKNQRRGNQELGMKRRAGSTQGGIPVAKMPRGPFQKGSQSHGGSHKGIMGAAPGLLGAPPKLGVLGATPGVFQEGGQTRPQSQALSQRGVLGATPGALHQRADRGSHSQVLSQRGVLGAAPGVFQEGTQTWPQSQALSQRGVLGSAPGVFPQGAHGASQRGAPSNYQEGAMNCRAHQDFDRGGFSADRQDAMDYRAHQDFDRGGFSADRRQDTMDYRAHQDFDRGGFSADRRLDAMNYRAHQDFDRGGFSADRRQDAINYRAHQDFDRSGFSADRREDAIDYHAHQDFDRGGFSADRQQDAMGCPEIQGEFERKKKCRPSKIKRISRGIAKKRAIQQEKRMRRAMQQM